MSRKIMWALLAAFVVISLLITGIVVTLFNSTQNQIEYKSCSQPHEYYGLTVNQSKMGTYSSYAVSVDSVYCSTVGKRIMEKNGSAVDAAIAVGLCNGVINMQSMGIGGGHLMTVYIKSEKKFYAIDARETAPINAHKDMLFNKSARYDGLLIGVPGELKGYEEAHKRFGKLPWRDLFEPTIELCESGVRVTKKWAFFSKYFEKKIRENKVLSSILINPEINDTVRENDVVRLPILARTLRLISEYGPEMFYNGALTPFIVDEINQYGGNFTEEDLINYKAHVYEDNIVMQLDDEYRMAGPPPPSSSILVAYILRIMKGFPLKQEKEMSANELSLFYHRLVEAMKYAYGKRNNLGDPDFVDVSQTINDVLNDTYVDEIRKKIVDFKTFPSSKYGEPSDFDKQGTAHFSVLDGEGNAVAVTSTINFYLGAMYAGDTTGIIYNNELADFSQPDKLYSGFQFKMSESNFIEPGKRPMSSMSPVIIVDKNDNVKLVLGASGGSRIISAVAQVILKSLWMNDDLKTSIDAARLHHQLYPEYLEFEYGFPKDTATRLLRVGHQTRCFEFGGSVIQGILTNDSHIYAYADPRKGGTTDGY